MFYEAIKCTYFTEFFEVYNILYMYEYNTYLLYHHMITYMLGYKLSKFAVVATNDVGLTSSDDGKLESINVLSCDWSDER